MTATTYLCRKTGSDANGGTSKTVQATATDGVTNVGNNFLTSASALFTVGMVGAGINIASNWRLITAYTSATQITYSGAAIATASGRTYTVGGSFLTLGKAAGQVVAGDSVYLGAGIYRETNTLATSGSAGNIITYSGDFDGVQTGDPGDVLVSNWLTDDVTAPTNTVLLTISSRIYLTFNHLCFLNGGSSAQTVLHSTLADHVVFNDCQFWATKLSGNNVAITMKTDANTACIFNRCIFVAGGAQQLVISIPTSTTADYDSGWAIRNCFFFGGNSVLVQPSGAGAFHGGGGTFSQNTGFGMVTLLNSSNAVQYSTLYPMKVWGNFTSCMSGTNLVAGGSNFSLVEDFNLFDNGTARTANDIGIGPNTPTIAYANSYETLDWLQTGRNPRPFLMPKAGSSILGLMPVGTQIAVGIPTVAADDATVGTIVWTNPNNALVFDTTFATCVMTTGTTGHYLLLTGFGFALPSTATVAGIRVEIIGKQSVTNNVLNNSIKLVKAGVIGGTDNVALMVALSTSGGNNIGSAGAASDLWGQTWLYSDVNAANFGVAISYKDTSGSSATANVDYVRIIVNYVDSAVTPTEQLTDFAQATRPAGGQIKIAAGAFERGSTAVQEVSTVHTGANAIKLAGPGYQDFVLAVNATSTAISAYLRYDGSYTGSTLPSLQVVNGTECGVANASVSQVGGANAWELVTLTIVPTSKGVVTIRASNFSTAIAGNAFVDTLAVV